MTWPTVPLRRIVTCLDGRRVPLNSAQRAEMKGSVPYWGAGGVLDFVDQAIFNEPLILLKEDGSPFFIPEKGVSYYVEGPSWINNHIHALRATGADGRFLAYALNCVDYANYLTGSTRDKLTQEDLKKIEIWQPPLKEQRRIVDFLDAETTRIDRLGQKLRQQVSLLEMRRQIQITHAVRGSDSDVQRPLHAVAEVILGRQRAPQHADGPHIVPYLRAANVKDGRLDLSDVMAMNFTPAEQRTFTLQPGDVLVTEGSGSIKAVGAAAVWSGEMVGTVCFQNTLLRIRPRQGLADGNFLEWWARSAFAAGEFASIATGANIYHLSAERVRSLRTRFPSLDEQRRIAAHLAKETRKVDRLIAIRGRQVELLTERRQALITAAVTGQFDVSTASGRNVTDGVHA
ncbi:restriction endonuclease subunit S [[Kitasatospora] papulosa]|uniref:restriction endonuclease subunit S n=1 Tax=[Kitasatospora] papulosa TaxID=1464011 RepID=UPI0036B44D5E